MHEYSPYNPLMLFKDFGANEPYVKDDSFITNADAPLFAIHNLAVPTINPFKGEDMIEAVQKEAVPMYTGNDNNGYVFGHDLSKSYSVHSSIFEESNWENLGL